MTVEQIEALSPVGEPGIAALPSAARLDNLAGKTVALLSNGLFRADVVLEAAAALIKARFPTARVIHWSELPVLNPMGNVDQGVKELTAALAEKRPDAVIASTGA